MTRQVKKFGNKLEDDAISYLSKGTWFVIGYLFLALAGFVFGRPEVGLSIAALLAIFGGGLWAGRWGARRQYRQNEAKRLEKAVANGNLFVVGAFYGAQAVWFDVTEVINTAIKEERSKLDVNDVSLLSDEQKVRALAVPKQLIFAYGFDEKIYAKEAHQNDKLDIESEGIDVVSPGA